jgi:maleylacetoacetate isomerase
MAAPPMPSLTLYNYWRSSSSYRVRIALALKGLDYAYVSVNLLQGEQSSDAHRQRSPTGYVPCLEVGGVRYVESVAIIEWLDETHPSPPLFPGTAHTRARIRALVEIVNSGTQPLQNLGVMARASADAAAQKEWSRHFNARGLAAFEAALEQLEREGVRGRFAHGDAPTAADVFLVPQVHSAKRFGVDFSALSRVTRAFEAAMALDAFRAAAPENQPDAPKT